jgi:hypothetical protein
VELELYNLHLKITNNLDYNEYNWWLDFSLKIKDKVLIFEDRKKFRLQKKFEDLINNSEPSISNYKDPLFVENFICNQSDEVFTEEEINLLNKGLNFAPKPSKPLLLESVVDVETVLKTKLPQTQSRIREVAKPIILNAKENARNCSNSKNQIIESLKAKDVYYLKADKGNSLVILNKTDYDNRMVELINSGSYKRESRNPLSKMQDNAVEVIGSVSKQFGLRLKWTLRMSNPTVPKMYGLPKIHKPGNKMRPIVSCMLLHPTSWQNGC